MATFVLTLLLVVLCVLGLAVGVLFRRRPLAGACGGLSCLKGIDCGACRARAGREPND